MARLNPQFYRDFSGGMATDLNLTLTPSSVVDLGLNLDFDAEIGSAVSRLGTSLIGAQLVDNNSILGLHQHVDHTNSSNNKLFATINASGGATSVIYDVVAGTTSVTGLTASKKMRFLTYGGATLAINGADAERSYTPAGGWITTGGVFDLADFPGSNSCELVIEFLDRVYTAGDSSEPDRLHYSTIFDGSAISWGGDYIDIEPEDGGGPITALAKVPGYLLIFKERSVKRFNGQSAFPESLVDIGTPSQESVVMGGGLVAFFSNSSEDARGFYITNGGRPVPISHDTTRPIRKWVDAIPTANDANIAGWATDRVFAWSVGDITIDGFTVPNVVLRYNRILNQWSVRSYPTEFKVFARYLVSGVNTIVGGDDDGQVIRVDKTGTYTDAPSTTNIYWKLRTKHDHYGFNQRKSIGERVVVRGKDLHSSRVNIIVDENYDKPVSVNSNPLWKRVLSFFGVGNTVDGTTIAVEIAGETKGARAYIREIELPSVERHFSYD